MTPIVTFMDLVRIFGYGWVAGVVTMLVVFVGTILWFERRK